jgi:glucokinase
MNDMTLTPIILAGDIGGTKTLLALFEVHGLEVTLLRSDTRPSRDFASLEAVIDGFLSGGARPPIAAACFGVPGVVVNGHATATNLPWTVDEKALQDAIPTPRVKLLNDLEAAAWGVLHLPPADLVALQAGTPRSGHKVLIAAGTGLGEALIIAEGPRHHVVASEGGHVDFAPRTALESALLEYLRSEFGHVSYERVLSGPGLLNIYRFLRDTRGLVEPQWLRDRLSAGDRSAAISEIGLAGGHPLCVEALDLFASIYGAEAGNLALKAMALGGVYVGGGIAPKIRAKLVDGGFIAAFRDKGRFGPLLDAIPVYLALDPRAPLLGAALIAARATDPAV